MEYSKLFEAAADEALSMWFAAVDPIPYLPLSEERRYEYEMPLRRLSQMANYELLVPRVQVKSRHFAWGEGKKKVIWIGDVSKDAA